MGSETSSRRKSRQRQPSNPILTLTRSRRRSLLFSSARLTIDVTPLT